MEVWWATLNEPLRWFYAIAISTSALMVLQLILMMLGIDGDELDAVEGEEARDVEPGGEHALGPGQDDRTRSLVGRGGDPRLERDDQLGRQRVRRRPVEPQLEDRPVRTVLLRRDHRGRIVPPAAPDKRTSEPGLAPALPDLSTVSPMGEHPA